MKSFKIFIETNITLALAAVFLSAASAVQFDAPFQNQAYLVFIFFGTFLAYNVHQIPGLIYKRSSPSTGFTKWARENKWLFGLLIVLALFVSILSIVYLAREVQVALIFISVISILYSFSVIPYKGSMHALRNLPYVKIFIITIVWSFATVILPAIELGVEFTSHLALVFIERLIFLAALAILFDIRDVDADTRANLKTIPVRIGEDKSILLSTGLLFVFLLVSVMHYSDSLFFILPAFALSMLSTLIFVVYTKIKVIPYFHYRVFDGTLLIQPLLVIVFYYLDKSGILGT